MTEQNNKSADKFSKSRLRSVFNDAIDILKLDTSKMHKVAAKKDATLYGTIILVAPVIFNVLLAGFSFPSGFGVIFSHFMFWPMLIPLIAIIVVIFGTSFVAEKMYKAKGSYIGFYRVVAYSSLVVWLSVAFFVLAIVLPIDPVGFLNLTWLVSVGWMLVVAYKMLQIHHKLKDNELVVVIAISIIGYFVVRGILGRVLMGDIYRFFY